MLESRSGPSIRVVIITKSKREWSDVDLTFWYISWKKKETQCNTQPVSVKLFIKLASLCNPWKKVYIYSETLLMRFFGKYFTRSTKFFRKGQCPGCFSWKFNNFFPEELFSRAPANYYLETVTLLTFVSLAFNCTHCLQQLN